MVHSLPYLNTIVVLVSKKDGSTGGLLKGWQSLVISWSLHALGWQILDWLGTAFSFFFFPKTKGYWQIPLSSEKNSHLHSIQFVPVCNTFIWFVRRPNHLLSTRCCWEGYVVVAQLLWISKHLSLYSGVACWDQEKVARKQNCCWNSSIVLPQ